jgi:putative NADH-flavin reductase
MDVLIFGATGMVGQGALRECLVDPEVGRVVVIGRTTTGLQHAKLREIAHENLLDFSGMDRELSGFDACFRSYRILYSATALLLPLLRALFPNHVTTTERLGRVMISLAKNGDEKTTLEARDVNRLSAERAY